MHLWQLRTFSVVAKNLHFTRASEELNLSQPAVSHQIKSLEKEIGEPLFVRDKDGVFLTKAGQTMYEHAEKILDIAEELSIEIKESKDALSGELVIGAIIQGLNSPFPHLYKGFKKKYKDIELVFQGEKCPEDVANKIRSGELDLGVIGRVYDLSGLGIMPFGEFQFVCVVAIDHPLTQKKQITNGDLQNQEWVMLKSPSRLRLWAKEALAKVGINPDKIMEINDGSVIRSMVANSEKISLLPEWGVFEDINDGKLVPIEIGGLETKIELIVAWKIGHKSKPINALLTYLLEEQFEGFEGFGHQNDEF